MELDQRLSEAISRFETNQPIEVYITGVEPVNYGGLARGIETKFQEICRQRGELLIRVDCQLTQSDQIIENLICRLYETLDANPFLCSQLANDFKTKYSVLYKSIVNHSAMPVAQASSALNKVITDLAGFQLTLYSERFAHWWNQAKSQLSFRNTIKSLINWLQNLLKIIVIPLIGIIKITYEVVQIIAGIIPSNAHWLGKKHIRILFTIYFPNNIERHSNFKEQLGLISTNRNATFFIFSRESNKISINDDETITTTKTINIFIRDVIGGTVTVGDDNQINLINKDSATEMPK